MKVLGVAALGLLLVGALVAEEGTQPNFSGTWIFNPEKSRLESTAPTKSVFVIDHQDPIFKLTGTHTRGENSNTLSFELTTDGKAEHQKEGDFETWSRMTWLGEELVLDMKMKYQGEEGTNVVHYRLTDGGKTFVAAEWYHMPKAQHHNLWVFDRAP